MSVDRGLHILAADTEHNDFLWREILSFEGAADCISDACSWL